MPTPVFENDLNTKLVPDLDWSVAVKHTDGCDEVVKVSQLKYHRPRHAEDFVYGEKYTITSTKWEKFEKPHVYRVYIGRIAKTEEELSACISKRRVKYPPLKETDTDQQGTETNYDRSKISVTKESNAVVESRKRKAAEDDDAAVFAYLQSSPLTQRMESEAVEKPQSPKTSSTAVVNVSSKKKATSDPTAFSSASVSNNPLSKHKELPLSSETKKIGALSAVRCPITNITTNAKDSVGSSALSHATKKGSVHSPSNRKSVSNSSKHSHPSKSKTSLANCSVPSAKKNSSVASKLKSKSSSHVKKVVSSQPFSKSGFPSASESCSNSNSLNSFFAKSVTDSAFNSEDVTLSETVHYKVPVQVPERQYLDSSFVEYNEKAELQKQVEYWKRLAMNRGDGVVNILERVCARLDSWEKKSDARFDSLEKKSDARFDSLEKKCDANEKSVGSLEKGVQCLETAFRNFMSEQQQQLSNPSLVSWPTSGAESAVTCVSSASRVQGKVDLGNGVLCDPISAKMISITSDLNTWCRALLIGHYGEEKAKSMRYRVHKKNEGNLGTFTFNFRSVAQELYKQFLERKGEQGETYKIFSLLSRCARDMSGRRNTGQFSGQGRASASKAKAAAAAAAAALDEAQESSVNNFLVAVNGELILAQEPVGMEENPGGDDFDWNVSSDNCDDSDD